LILALAVFFGAAAVLVPEKQARAFCCLGLLRCESELFRIILKKEALVCML
jgi:hypothetical protein